MPTHRRTGLVAVAIAVLLLGAAACSSSSEGSDPTTTPPPTASGTVPPDDDEPGTTTTTEKSRTGTTLIDDEEDPPTGDETEEEYIAALVSTFEEDDEDIFTREDVECLAAAWVPIIGVEAFQAAGITPADIESGDSSIDDVVIDQATGEEIVDSIPGCGIDLYDLFLDGLGPNVKDDPQKLACVQDAVTEEQIRESLVADLLGNESPADDEIKDLVDTCLA